MDDARAVRRERGGLLQGVIIPQTKPGAFLFVLIPEIAALHDAMAHAGNGAKGAGFVKQADYPSRQQLLKPFLVAFEFAQFFRQGLIPFPFSFHHFSRSLA